MYTRQHDNTEGGHELIVGELNDSGVSGEPSGSGQNELSYASKLKINDFETYQPGAIVLYREAGSSGQSHVCESKKDDSETVQPGTIQADALSQALSSGAGVAGKVPSVLARRGNMHVFHGLWEGGSSTEYHAFVYGIWGTCNPWPETENTQTAGYKISPETFPYFCSKGSSNVCPSNNKLW